jgi:hypothetical protein
MSALTEAREALAAAQRKADDARLTAAEKASAAASLRAAVVAGNAEGVTAQELALAAQEAEHAALLSQGAEQSLPALSEALQALSAGEVCDAVAGRLRELGSNVLDTLDTLTTDIMPLAEAVRAYDTFAEQATHRLHTVAGASSRVKIRRNMHSEVDGLSLQASHGWEQLAAVIAPAAQSLGAPDFVVQQLKELAQGRPTLPSTEAGR